MAEKKDDSTSRDVLSSLIDFVEGPAEDALTEPIDAVRQELKDDGIDTTALKKFVRDQLRESRAATKLDRARSERAWLDSLRQRTVQIKREPGPALRQEVLAIIQGLAGAGQEVAQVYHRKFEQATDDDLLTLLDDIALLNAADKARED